MNSNKLFSSIKFLLLPFLFCMCQIQFAAAQTISLNQDGEKIILYNDGSWRYFDNKDPKDIALLEKSDLGALAKKKNPKKNPKKKAKKTQKPKKNKVAKGKTPKRNDKKKKGDDRYAKKTKPQKTKKGKSNSKRYAKTKTGKKQSKPSMSGSGSRDYGSIINKEIIDIRDKQNMALEKERIASFATSKYTKELKLAKKRKLSKQKIRSIEAKAKEAKLQLKFARDQNKVLLKQRRAYESILKSEPAVQGKEYAKLAQRYNKDHKLVPTFEDESIVISEVKKKDKSTKRSKSKGKRANPSEAEAPIVYSPNEQSGPISYDVSYPSSKPNAQKAAIPKCNIVFQGKDSFSGKKRTDLGRSPFFSFTSKKMRSYFQDKDMIQCDAYLSAVAGGYKFICIEVVVASETAQKSYGSLKKQGQLSVKLVDGTTVNLFNNKTDDGTLDPIKKTVIYKAQYLIPSEHVKTLSKVDIDKVRLVWSTGYEDYKIYETDFLINQLACLDK